MSDSFDSFPQNLANRRAQLLVQAKEATGASGCYLMKDENSQILYIGKAKNLKNRLTSYFQPATHPIPRIELLVSRIHHFDVVLTETESEALLLENTLIKRHKPKFNVSLKDDKTYPYLFLSGETPFPRLEYTRKVAPGSGRYYGPFPSAYSARQVARLLTEVFKLRDCSDNTFKHRSRPCILYQMSKCTAPCVQLVDQKGYETQIAQIEGVLKGDAGWLIEELRTSMENASQSLDYERAAFLRDQIENLKLVIETQSVIEAGARRNRDVVAIARKETMASGVVLQVRMGRLVAVRAYHLEHVDPSMGEAEVLDAFLGQHYLQKDVEREEPLDVLLERVPEDAELLELSFKIRPQDARTKEDEQLLKVAKMNVEHALEHQNRRSKGVGIEALEEVQNKLDLPKLPHRIECFDISNIQSSDAVASRVVFVEGAPDPSLYRRYKIRTVEGQNDFAMMKEVLSRRFMRKEDPFPDLVVVDGGKGQLAQAVAILDELGVTDVPVVGLAKARTERDFSAKEVEASLERLFVPGRKNPILLYPNTGAYRLMTQVRDEAHRFAVNYHRKLRSKRTLGEK